jgi:phosphoglucosamine mutase
VSRLFGTDGIRGVANVDLKPPPRSRSAGRRRRRLVGPGRVDRRRTGHAPLGDMFVAAIAAGATSLGVTVHVVGVVPTPALAFFAAEGPTRGGIMVSASHNPAEDNGLKVLDSEGLKLDDAVEDEIEQLIWRSDELVGAAPTDLGTIVDARERLGATWRTARARPTIDASGCGSCSTAQTAPHRRSRRRSSARPGAAVEVINDQPTA